LAAVGKGHVRVLLRRTRAPTLCGAAKLRDARRDVVRLRESHRYRVTARGAAGLTVTDVTTGRRRARVRAPATVRGGASWCLRGRADNGVRNGDYRGRALLSRSGRRILVVNRVALESYLLGVVAAEMPASWSAEALAAQAVIARSYALRSRRPASPFDVYADARSQVYGGRAREWPTTTAAVRATRAEVVTYAGEIAQTFFFSTSGGRTADNEEVWGGAPVPYLRSVADPHDDISPYHDWTVTFTDRQLRERLASVAPGQFQGLRVSERTPSGRAATVAVTGSGGTADVAASRVEALLGLRSTWFSFRQL
jgi:stage II sporulation protein D